MHNESSLPSATIAPLRLRAVALILSLLAVPAVAGAQQNVPAPVQRAESTVEQTVKRFGVGISGGVTLDPELLDIGAHATFGPLFTPALRFRPGVELAFGEVTTMLAINLEMLYELRGAVSDTRWMPYLGAGPNFGFSHRRVDTDDIDDDVDGGNRFDFSDTDANGGFNFIAGARHANGMFIEMKATAYGVSAIRLLAGFNF